MLLPSLVYFIFVCESLVRIIFSYEQLLITYVTLCSIFFVVINEFTHWYRQLK